MTTATPESDVSVQGRGSYLRTCVLLLLSDGPAHGYDILVELAARGLGNVDAGGLYRALRAMDDEGLVVSHWEHSATGPSRRVYVLTEDGRQWLARGAEAARDLRRRLNRLLRHYRSVTGGSESPPS